MNFDAEWLEPDGRGGFASGTVGGVRTRRYHALLLPATHPPVGRMVLINGLEVFLETASGRFPLSTQRYPGGDDGKDILHPRGLDHLANFRVDPWPRWTFEFPDGTRLEHEIFVHQPTGLTALSWKLASAPRGDGNARLEVRPLFSGRDYHATHHENPVFAFTPVSQQGGNAAWQMYPGLPLTRLWSNGMYRHEPAWYRNFLYSAERDRGLDCLEDLALPGVFTFELTAQGQEACLLLGAVLDPLPGNPPGMPPSLSAAKLLPALRADEQKRRSRFADPLDRSADAYIVRGACADRRSSPVTPGSRTGGATRLSRCAAFAWRPGVLKKRARFSWAGPAPSPPGCCRIASRIAERRRSIIRSMRRCGSSSPRTIIYRSRRRQSVKQPWNAGPATGANCSPLARRSWTATPAAPATASTPIPPMALLLAGEPGVALTWMDVVIDAKAITPRTGKPVEIQALWLNALCLMAPHSSRWRLNYERAQVHFAAKFWNAARGCLYDVIDCDGQPGVNDDRVRPNQIFAVGGLPVVLLETTQARAVLQTLERELLTPAGLRTLARGEPGYCPEYVGGPVQRDSAYHQGTVWPWLLGPFVEAWVRLEGDTPAAQAEAKARFVEPLLAALPTNIGLNHLAEIGDAEPPHAPKGCPYQAWSVGELARLARQVLR